MVRISQRRKGFGSTPNNRKTDRLVLANGPEFTR
jgi:hypothetical protein